jgi:hypothetical protein
MNYGQLVRFMLPLVVMVLVQEFGEQVLNAGMARMPRATETLAGYGLAWGLTSFLSGALTQARQLGLVLVTHKQAYWPVSRFVLAVGVGLAGLLACLAFTSFGTWVIEDVHSAKPSLAAVVQQAFFWLIPLPVFRGLARFYGGMLLQVRRTDVVSVGTIASIGMSIVTVFVLLSTDLVHSEPILLPLFVTYAGILTEFAIVWWGTRRFVKLETDVDASLSFGYIIRFFWPLALIMAVQAGTRPLINLFVSRASDGTEALAVLTIVYALGHVPYGWVNEVRSLPVAFKDEPEGRWYISRFVIGCGLVSFVSMLVLFWTPVSRYLLETVIGVGPELAMHSETPLLIFLGFPFVVALRAYYHGIGLVEHRTQVMAPSAPSRIAAVTVMFIVLSQFEMHTATRAIGALVSGHTVEALVVWWAIRDKRVRAR